MREQKSGPIIAKMDPGKAEKLTAALADRRALPKTAP
jgi:flagellar motility protein MotE (MotC chaperone)